MNVIVDHGPVKAADPALPTLLDALNPDKVDPALTACLRNEDSGAQIELKTIRVTRYKPGRRCLIEYQFRATSAGTPPRDCTWIGKIRRLRSGSSALRLMQTLWRSGFNATSDDGVSVPEPIGKLPELKLWLQNMIAGEDATELLAQDGAVELAQHIAYAAWKLHRVPVATDKRHCITDELDILANCFNEVSGQHPQWQDRLERLLDRARTISRHAPQQRACGIHRDFYADQVIVTDKRLWLIDFDLYCEGDPGLDVGNFIGHLTEQALRTFGDYRALENVESAMEERFLELSGNQLRSSVRLYTLLTLMRHIFLSTKHADRRPFTEELLSLCEERAADSGWLTFLRPSLRHSPVPASALQQKQGVVW